MISINKALEKIINDSPFLEDWLYNEYINLTSLSSYIKPKIELLTKKEVTIWAIKMALSRFIKEKQRTIKYRVFNTNDFFIKKTIGIIYIEKNNETINIIKDINSLWILKDDDYLTIIQWWKNISIIYNENIKNTIENMVWQKYIELKINDLSLIWVYFDVSNINEIWLLYTLTKKINFNNINIIELISSYKEIHFIVKNEDLKKTINALII